MRDVLIFAGSSCPALATQICYRLGTTPAEAELSQFANGEISVKILTSIRDKDVFVVQSGSSRINDSIMELLILISACKGGSANKVTVVLPYFPYSRQSKKKTHRGAITARMLANLLDIAGVKHVITIDLHASQMQGFFRCPVDNLHAEPLIATWIRHSVPNWREAVCVSKNPGGTKRVTSLADALKLNFGMITTEKKRGGGNVNSGVAGTRRNSYAFETRKTRDVTKNDDDSNSRTKARKLKLETRNGPENSPAHITQDLETSSDGAHKEQAIKSLSKSTQVSESCISRPEYSEGPASRSTSTMIPSSESSRQAAEVTDCLLIPAEDDVEFIDEKARDITQGRLVHGHIVPDDYPSPSQSSTSISVHHDRLDNDSMENVLVSCKTLQEVEKSRGAEDVVASSDEEEESLKDPKFEHMITLVGDVRNRTVFIIDDMIDKAGTWIAAAECVVKRGGAKKVYCIATHGLFGGDSLDELQDCDCIDTIVVTNSFPIPPEKIRTTPKLVILDLTRLLSEAIRRNHFGESISALFAHSDD
ncbi:hypothetical protein K3495_g4352 [Podosphaera aphanis]|nr:hypothetical protein K3495_g4352 [Podosphaera aphanis]